MLVNSHALVHEDSRKPITIVADASPYRIGAVVNHIINGEKIPIIFVSKTLSYALKNYAQIQREALVLHFAIKIFHKYIYGRHFTLVTYQKTLLAILGTTRHFPTWAAARLDRWAVTLSVYNCTFIHKKRRKRCECGCHVAPTKTK